MDWFRVLALVVMGAQLAGCGFNSSVAISATRARPIPGRAVLVFSVERKGDWPHQDFALQLDQYDLSRQNISGNCIHFERVTAVVPFSASGDRKYFAFSVAPGAFAYSRFNGATLNGPSQAFILPAEQVTYVGDFVYDDATAAQRQRLPPQEDAVTFKMDLAQAEKATGSKLVPAQVVAVTPPRAFMCAP
jgi:hypothetical protein